MQYLKALVIGMGILIVLSVLLLVYGLLSKTSSNPNTDATPMSDTMTGFGEIALQGNSGCQIAKATPDGRRLVIHLTGDDLGCQKAVIIDMSKGTVIGTIALEP
ncbi:MAG: hypothetical protein HN644_09775 [Rhodospirillales bacterium]|jgi:hypothetical protein|nr:hypothetical protein [Rhodospirillales bacterium]MBT4041081.1 hypothetical protein [Rhodospirillales bacterium]MBT4628404.1 hypothetical protein [Rhodospirillales bacterium]MBT5350821.1 hypothetical protein [Rhodospirillales bacterium]MBT5519612.1 hypothetical protein [Rhodospirillales bacterium]